MMFQRGPGALRPWNPGREPTGTGGLDLIVQILRIMYIHQVVDSCHARECLRRHGGMAVLNS